MKLDIHFRHMDRSEALEDVVTEKVTQVIENFLHRHDAHVQVWLVKDVGSENRGAGSFTCEIEVRTPHKKDFFLHKSNSDMHVAIGEATLTLKTLLDESGKKELDNRRQPRMDATASTKRAE